MNIDPIQRSHESETTPLRGQHNHQLNLCSKVTSCAKASLMGLACITIYPCVRAWGATGKVARGAAALFLPVALIGTGLLAWQGCKDPTSNGCAPQTSEIGFRLFVAGSGLSGLLCCIGTCLALNETPVQQHDNLNPNDVNMDIKLPSSES